MKEIGDEAHLDARRDYLRDTVGTQDVNIQHIESEEKDYESAPPDYSINTYPADFTLEVLHSKWRSGDIEIPPFQREFVWKQVQSSKLIESFLVGLPVPAIFLYTERQSQRFLVIDGQQRLRSIFYFFDGLFGEEEKGKRTVFKLKGLNDDSRYAGKGFEDLDDAAQRRLRNSVLRSFIVQQLDPNDDTSIYHIFERLNTGGTLLANQEIRNCVYRGTFNDLINQLNLLTDWRRIVGNQHPDRRKKDVELILRFFAFLSRDGYKKPMKDYLSRFMGRNQSPSDQALEAFRGMFTDTSLAVATHLGDKPFHIRSGLNSAVFDCVMVSFAKNLQSLPDDLERRYRRLVEKEEFLKNVNSGTTDEEVVHARFESAERELFQR